MRRTDDLAPLVDIAEREYERLERQAYDALTALHGFWTRLYGPNEALEPAWEALSEMRRTWDQDSDAS